MHTFKICDECGVKDLSDNLQLFPLKKKLNKKNIYIYKKKKKKKKTGMRTSDSLQLLFFSVLLEESDLYFVQRWGYKQCAIVSILFMSLCVRKSTILVSDQVRHKPGCTITMLEFVSISRRGNVLSV